MAEPSERLGFPLEAGYQERIESRARLQQLDREDLLEPEMGGAVNNAGGPFAEAILQTVLPVEDAGKGDDLWLHGLHRACRPSMSAEPKRLQAPRGGAGGSCLENPPTVGGFSR